MGTHPNLPSTLSHTNTTLASHLASKPDLIGEQVGTKFEDTKEGNLPFLFKVLSIGTALSIQAHPSKDLARKLFKERPDVYKGEWDRM
jgi:mannose-6-phosphate isomerase